MAMGDSVGGSTWTREQDKAFENALAEYGNEEGDERWEKIAVDVPGKTVGDVKNHFELLMEDINGIESGRVPLPRYVSSSQCSADHRDDGGKKGGSHRSDAQNGGKASKPEQERRKGVAWTEDEHRLFLLGLEKYGKGDWRSISRNFVVSRTPTQVASHAQKYYIRLNSMNKDRRRSSIHDITSVGSGEASTTQGPITGASGATVVTHGISGTQPPNHPSAPAGTGVYGTPTIGQPFGAPVASAVGTPVHLPVQPRIAYGAHAPVVGKVVPGTAASTSPAAYPMPNMSTHR